MRKVFRLAFAVSLASSAATAQVTSMESANPIPKGVSGSDLNKIVCEVDQTTGTRLGATKVCRTVLEWQQLRTQHREGVEMFQRNGTSVGCQEGQSCGG